MLYNKKGVNILQEGKKEIRIQDVISKRKEHSRKVDTKLIMKAYNYAYSHHGDQCRRSRRTIYYSSS